MSPLEKSIAPATDLPPDDQLIGQISGMNDMLAAKLEEQQAQIQALQQQLKAVTGGPGWKLLSMIWPVRRLLIPPHSKREEWLFRGMQTASRVRRDGLHALRAPASPTETAASQVEVISLPQAHLPPAPKATVLIVSNPGDAIAGDAREWVAHQTWPNVNVVAHDGTNSTRESWGRYVCVASSDLLEQPETYLETNLVLLEREESAFSINLKAMPVWVTLQMQQQLLPGSSDNPLLRQVARACCVNDRLQIDVSTWLRDRQNHPVNESITLGNIIRWTTNESERFSSLPMQSRLEADSHFRLDGQRLMTTAEQPQIAGAAKKKPANALFAPPAADDSRPTVLVFMPFLAVGGAERVALDMVQHLSSHVRFVIVATDPHDAALGTTADQFRQFTPFVYTAHDILPHDQAGPFLAYLINRFSPQCLYIANGSGWLYDALPQIKSNFPHLRIANQVYDHQAGWINRYDAMLARTIDSHIGVNTKICEAYVRAGVPAENTHLIEHGIDIAEFDPARYDAATIQSLKRAFNVPDQLKVVTFIARLHPQKRPMDFVEVARQMRDDTSVRFLMVGDGPLASQVNDEVNRMNLKNFIRRSFYQPSRDVFAISDVIVLPSEYEGMPVTILEAQSMGKPVVVTDVGNTRDVLALTQGGIVVPRIGDANALREGVMRALRMQIDVESTRAKLDAHFGAPVIAAKYLQALLGREA